MISDLDLWTPDPAAASSGMLTAICPVYSVDRTARLVRIGVRDEVMWLPAQPGRYQSGASSTAGLARVLIHPTTGRAELVLGPLDPVAPSQLATVTAVSGGTVTVSWAGAAAALPAIPATYSVGSSAWVDTDDWGTPYLVRGPSTLAVPSQGQPRTDPGSTARTVTASRTITPQWSGTYRATRSAWDRWNADRRDYGGRSTLYQGSAFGSGPLIGLACYGAQISALGATSITRARVMLRGVGLSGASGPATVQGSPHGSRPSGAPATVGATATGTGWTDLPAATREAMRTGSIRGLALVGSRYWAVAGAGNGDGMVLSLTYTRRA